MALTPKHVSIISTSFSSPTRLLWMGVLRDRVVASRVGGINGIVTKPPPPLPISASSETGERDRGDLRDPDTTGRTPGGVTVVPGGMAAPGFSAEIAA